MRLRFWRRRPVPSPPRDLLAQATGEDRAWWLDYVQQRIKARSRPSADPNHDATDVRRWVRDVLEELYRRMPHGGGDANMGMASLLGFVLTYWYVRVHHAKAFDPSRPVRLRMQALVKVGDYQASLLAAWLDERHDARHFPGQTFEPPYTPDATDGSFV
jgi:hypothetical protein